MESMTLFNTLDLTHLPPLGKEYLCFRVDNKYPHAAQCVKSRVLNKAIDSNISINTFEQQFVVIKCMLQSSGLEHHMNTIIIDQSSFTRYYFEHRCMKNIKNIYQHAGNCDYQQNLKDILEDTILSTPEVFTDNIPNVHMTSSPVKKPSARKSLCLFTNILDVKPTTAKRRFLSKKYCTLSLLCVWILQPQNNVWTFKVEHPICL